MGFNVSVPNDVPREDRARLYAALLDRVRSVPGVARAGLISFLPPELRAGVFMGIAVDGVAAPAPGEPARRANTLVTSADYFSTMRIPIVRGRDLTEGDDESHPPVIVVNEAFVRRYLPDGDPIGRRIGTGFDGMKPVREIVGVVRDTYDRGVVLAPYPTVFISFRQFALPYGAVAVRTTVDAASVLPAIRERIRQLNPAVPITDVQELDDRLSESLREPRLVSCARIACIPVRSYMVMRFDSML